ncbi:hypothetical protein EKO27_g5208 [Xylaria grammica]|uniref:DJ-1/PfpI domain-containing protein n=1 Tax=Xylaria grammica TaxID=363999 RepID=A0A439D665_9PEZI|nr:hypothetical protein EKO27_g5208 [Xylaria grammica]
MAPLADSPYFFRLYFVVGIDIFGTLPEEYFPISMGVLPGLGKFAGQTLDLTVYYLAASASDAKPVAPGLKYVPNISCDDYPRDPDFLLVSGPPFDYRDPPAMRFVREARERTPVWLTICFGSI